MMISLHSDEGLFSELSEVFAETNSENPSRENLVPEHVHMSQVLAMLPGMSAEVKAAATHMCVYMLGHSFSFNDWKVLN